jgi:hypothetical protein
VRAVFKHMDPWGNSIRHYADPVDAARQLEAVYKMRGTARLAEIVNRAQAYVATRKWSAAGELLNAEISRTMTERNGPGAVERKDSRPVTVPHPVAPYRDISGG